MEPDDSRSVKKPNIVLGEDLALLSVAELKHRIERLESEIERARQAIAAKQSSKSAADAFFRS